MTEINDAQENNRKSYFSYVTVRREIEMAGVKGRGGVWVAKGTFALRTCTFCNVTEEKFCFLT